MTHYNPVEFWKERGKIVENVDKDLHQRHIFFIPILLDDLEFKSVLEVGCGDGRITKLLLEQYNIEKYDVIDMSEDRIKMHENNIRNLPGNRFLGQIQDFESKDRYDLVISVSTLLHVLPEDIEKALSKMKDLSKKYVVNVDFQPASDPGTLANYNFIHDYKSIYSKLGLSLKQRRIENEVIYIGKKN